MMVKLKRNDSFQLIKMKKVISLSITQRTGWTQWWKLAISSCRNEYDSTWYHVVVQFIPLHSPNSLSLIPERYLNWTQLIESDNLFIWKNLYDGKSTIQSLLGRKKKVNDGSLKWRWWNQRWKWLTAQIVGRWKGVERRKLTIESLLEIVIGWKYGVCREEKRRLSCEFSFEWIRKKWLFSFKNSSNTKVIFLNITLRTGLTWKKNSSHFKWNAIII